jgi:hexosaminidase
MRFSFIFIFIASWANLRAANPDSLFLIPQPKKIELRNGVFNFSNPYSVSIINTDKFYLEQLGDAMARKFKTNPAAGVNKIRLVKADSSDYTSILETEKLEPHFALGAEGYILSIASDNVLIVAHENAGIFYAVQTLIQLLNANTTTAGAIPCMVIYDKPDMGMRGWQDDISRGPIPTMDFLKEEIQRMSSFKLNTFTLYTEHVFKLKKHPGIAPADGISEEEVKELSAFARNYHVDLIGNFQSFGHFKNILHSPGYENLGDNDNTLSPAKEEAYKFLADAYSEIAPAYDSKYFHINCDEVSLSSGPCQKIIDSIGMEGVYANHINRIDSLLRPYHKRIMMWGDIAVHNPKIIERLPKDMIIVSWGYGEMESMEEEILPFVKSGFQFIVAPGVSCWSRIYPDLQRASINIYNYLRDGYKHKALGFINTTWDDSGQNLFNNNWYSLVWGADCGWNAPVSVDSSAFAKDSLDGSALAKAMADKSEVTRKGRLASFNRSYNKVYFETDKDITSLLLGISGLRYGPVKNCLSDGAIWSPLLPDYNIIPENYERDNLNLIKSIDSIQIQIHAGNAELHRKAAQSLSDSLRVSSPRTLQELELMQFALRQARVVANKNLLGIKLKNYIASDSIRDIRYFERDFAALSDTIAALKPVYGKLWALENRNWWLDTVYSYYDSFLPNLYKLKGVCIIKASDNLVNGKREIRLRSAFNDLPVYYTTDGTLPTLSSAKYSDPIYSDSSIHIQARVIDNERMYDVASDSFVFHKGIGKLYKLNSKWNTDNPAYAARGDLGLLDGRRGSKINFSDGRWQGYFGDDIDIELDLGEATAVSKITMGFAQLMRYGILYPQQIEVSASPDGNNYKLIKTEVNTIEPNTEERSTHDYVIPFKNLHTRHIKIVAKNTRVLPEWHYAKGKTGWLFSDEIIVEF